MTEITMTEVIKAISALYLSIIITRLFDYLRNRISRTKGNNF